MISTATRASTETTADDPRNALLDAFENQVQALLDNGLEAPLRARLARLLPAPVAVPAGRCPTALEWGVLLVALRATAPRDSAAASAIRSARVWVIEQMQAAQLRETHRT